MQLTLPYWFKMRQGKAEAAGESVYRLTAPNLPEMFISVRKEGDGWKPVVRSAADGPDTVADEVTYRNVADAWNAAFERYRYAVVV